MNPLLEAGTAVISDIFDSEGRTPSILASLPSFTASPRFVGPAYTIAGESHTSDVSGDRVKLDAIDSMPPGVVPVWAGGDISGVCCFGDLLAEAMKQRGCAGVVVDGGIRDVSYLSTLDMPIIARYRTPAQAIGRWKVVSCQEPVRVRGGLDEWVTVNPGDIVVSDEDGVIVVPAVDVERIEAKVKEWAMTETESRTAIQDGMSLTAALDTFGHL
jgi:regulator of RNase E activity RraA